MSCSCSLRDKKSITQMYTCRVSLIGVKKGMELSKNEPEAETNLDKNNHK